MGLELASYVADLVATNPDGGDDLSTGDEHLRLIKSVLVNSFPSVSGAVTVTHTELNELQAATLDTTKNSQGTKTVSASAPSGGVDGDIWYQT